jgi:hypothetical protein
MLYNFRIDQKQTAEIIARLQTEKALSQGWGGAGTDLNLRDPDFVQRVRDNYSMRSTRRPTNLTRIRQFKNGDKLIIPHLPQWHKVTICEVDGDYPACYVYVPNDDTHLNHRIRVKRVLGLDGNVDMRSLPLVAWYGKLPYLRLPVLAIPQYESAVDEILTQLGGNPAQVYESSTLTAYLEEQIEQTISALTERLYNAPASAGAFSFEAVCRHVVEQHGYVYEGGSRYDRQGGDVDLRFVRERTDASPFETGDARLVVQVKKHRGVTDEYAVEQVSKIIGDERDTLGCVMSLADEFSEAASKLAEERGIQLMNGDQICRLLLKSLLG